MNIFTGAKLVTSIIVSFNANNYAETLIGGIAVPAIVLQSERLDWNQVMLLHQIEFISVKLN